MKLDMNKVQSILNKPLPYKQMAKELGIKYVNGASKMSQLKKLQSLVEIKITKNPTRYTITRIYDEAKPIPNKNLNEHLREELERFCKTHYLEIVGELPATLMYKQKIDFRCNFHPQLVQHTTIFQLLRSIGCPLCTYPMSRFEVMLYLGLKNNGALHRKRIDGIEYDIILPEQKIAVEVDGALFHSGEKEPAKEQKKYEVAKNNGYRLIKIYESTSQEKCENHREGDKVYIMPYQSSSKENRDKIISLVQQLLPYEHSEALWDEAAIYMREWKNNVHKVEQSHPIRQYSPNGELITEYKNFNEIKNAIASGEAFGFNWQIE